ncbi:MAG TPA: hypothetical protein VEH27_11895 [Methylomirabilota bacterium]|nr:hypothetical protein [Methylomirabilota bacterium]
MSTENTSITAGAQDRGVTITDLGDVSKRKPEEAAQGQQPAVADIKPEEFNELLDHVFGGAEKPKKKKEEPSPKADDAEPSPAPEPPKKNDDDEKAKQASPANQPTDQSAPTAIDQDALAQKVAQQVSATLKPAAPEPAKVTPGQDVEISEEDRRTAEVYRLMAESNPKYKGLDEQYTAFAKTEAAYRKEWEAKHPGKQFDPDAGEHVKFYEENEPAIEEDDEDDFNRAFIKAEAKLETRAEIERVKAELKRERLAEQLPQKIEQATAAAQDMLLEAVDPELKGTSLKDLAAKDELAAEIVSPAVDLTKRVVEEVERLWTPGLGYSIDLTNPLHKKILEEVGRLEQEIAENPAGLVPDGKKFAPLAEFTKMTPAQQAKHWTPWVDGAFVRAELVKTIAENTKASLTKWRKLAGVRKDSDNTPAAQSTPGQSASAAQAPAPTVAKPQAPNTKGGDDTHSNLAKGSKKPTNENEEICNILFGR